MFQMISEEMELKRLWTVYLGADRQRIMLKDEKGRIVDSKK